MSQSYDESGHHQFFGILSDTSVLSELYAYSLFLVCEMIEEFRNKFRKWKETSESKHLKDNLVTPKGWSLEALQWMTCLSVQF